MRVYNNLLAETTQMVLKLSDSFCFKYKYYGYIAIMDGDYMIFKNAVLTYL